MIACLEKKYIGLKLDEMEMSWNVFTIDEVKIGGCRHKKFTLRVVTNKYDDEKDEDHPNNREEYNTWKINEMTYVCIAEY